MRGYLSLGWKNIAFAGQASEQLPQVMHFVLSTIIAPVLSLMDIAATGQASMQGASYPNELEQPLQETGISIPG